MCACGLTLITRLDENKLTIILLVTLKEVKKSPLTSGIFKCVSVKRVDISFFYLNASKLNYNGTCVSPFCW